MKRVKITSMPKNGNQKDYSLYRRLKFNEADNYATDDKLKDTLSAVPREEANIEAERGETVIGDINNDGNLDHMKIGGKKHSQGGTPLDISEGSFIFSNTRKLKIKDKDILEKFDMGKKSGGYTPAEIAKNFEINKYKETLKNPDTDAIAKRSAQQMIDKNVRSLAELALIQESMKGFPDGVPSLVESVMPGITDAIMQQQAQEQPTMQEAKYGGELKKFTNGGGQLPKASNGKTFKTTIEGEEGEEEKEEEIIYPNTFVKTNRYPIYINGEKFKYIEIQDNKGLGTGDSYIFENIDNPNIKVRLNKKEVDANFNKNPIFQYLNEHTINAGYKTNSLKPIFVTHNPKKYEEKKENIKDLMKNPKTEMKQKDIYYVNGNYYEVEDPMVGETRSQSSSNKKFEELQQPGMGTLIGMNVRKIEPIFDNSGKYKGKKTDVINPIQFVNPNVILSAKQRGDFDYIPYENKPKEIKNKETSQESQQSQKNSTSEQLTGIPLNEIQLEDK